MPRKEMSVAEARRTKTPEQFVRYKHQYRISDNHGGYRPECACGTLRSTWSLSYGVAVDKAEKHIQNKIRREVQYRERIRTQRTAS
jgi:hypothetical protein